MEDKSWIDRSKQQIIKTVFTAAFLEFPVFLPPVSFCCRIFFFYFIFVSGLFSPHRFTPSIFR